MACIFSNSERRQINMLAARILILQATNKKLMLKKLGAK